MNEKIRVLYLITDLGKGGAQRYLIDLCAELMNRDNIEFRIGTLYQNNQYAGLTDNFHIENLFYQTFSLQGKNENIPYKNLLKTFNPHIIHTHLFLGEFLSSYYPDKNIKYVCHCHDNMEQFGNFSVEMLLRRKKMLQFIEKQYLILHKYNKIKTFFIANSTHTEQYFKKSLPAKMKNNVKLLYYGFNFYRFHDNTPKHIDVTKPVRILNVGSFQDKKNQVLLIAVAKELKRRNIAFEMNLIGDGENFNNIQKAIIENNLEREVFLQGIINNVEEWYKSSDIYLHAAYYEPFGLIYLEAMAAGLPVITLDGKGNRDIIEEGKNGFMIYKQNAELFAGKIIELIENRELYQAISTYAVEFARKYDIKGHVDKLIDYYNTILSF